MSSRVAAAAVAVFAATSFGCEGRPLTTPVSSGAGGQPAPTGAAGTSAPLAGRGGGLEPAGAGGGGAPEPTSRVAEIAAGHYHSCARMANGTVRCWGFNYGGMIGDGTAGNVRLAPVPVAGLSGVIRILADYTDSCAQLADGSWRCWGSNNYGQLGDGTTSERHTPVSVLGDFVVRQLSLGAYHSCALLNDATVRCYGANYAGQLGDGTMVDRLMPTPLNPRLVSVVQIAAGPVQSCALHESGAVSCWGYNSSGALGDGTTTDRPRPGPVSGISRAWKIVVGANVACALVAGGSVSCWGYNGQGQVGDGTTINRTTPTTVPGLSGVSDLAAGESHVCALLADRTISCWGFNAHGQLGDGSRNDRSTPTPVPGLADVAQISLGVTHSCALLTSGNVLCWGDELALVRDKVPNDPYVERLSPTQIEF